MPLRKSHLYSSLWKSCDELRGGMAASQYKDYVLTLLFMKYVSDKYADDDEFADIRVPPGGKLRRHGRAQGEHFDFAVANPPFSDKAWTNGLNPAHDEYRRFEYRNQ